MVVVYQFKVWDVQLGDWVLASRKSSEDRISRCGGKVIPGTAEHRMPVGPLALLAGHHVAAPIAHGAWTQLVVETGEPVDLGGIEEAEVVDAH